MKPPRFTIFGMMLVVFLVAANIGLLRFVQQFYGGLTLEFAIIVLPMANVVVALGAKLVRQLARSGEAGSFLLGFELVGVATCLVVALGMLYAVEVLEPYYELTFHWMKPTYMTLIQSKDRARVILGDILCFGWLAIVSTGPQLAIAALAGWTCKALRLTLVRRKLADIRPLEPIEAHQ